MSQHGESLTGQREDPNPHRRLQWVLGGRLIIATVLLGTTMYLALDAIRYGRFTPTFLLILISAIYGSSILFGVWLLRGRQENVVAAAGVQYRMTQADMERVISETGLIPRQRRTLYEPL